MEVVNKTTKLKWDWGYLWGIRFRSMRRKRFKTPSVTDFQKAPLRWAWNHFKKGIYFNVQKECKEGSNHLSYETAKAIKFRGYLVKLRLERYKKKRSKDIWLNINSPRIEYEDPTPLDGKNRAPEALRNLRKYIISHNSELYKVGDMVEILDKDKLSQVQVAKVIEVKNGRLLVSYMDGRNVPCFWCHEAYELVHPLGWAKAVGHTIVEPENYNPGELDLSQYEQLAEGIDIQVGMKLEAVDPLNTAAICPASIMKVLKGGFFMLRIDCYPEHPVPGSDWFCYHVSSPYIFPCGFCMTNNINFQPPIDWKNNFHFHWDTYLKEMQGKALGLKGTKIKHKFKVGMMVEAVDLMRPSYIGVATITRVVGRLLRINFDGWGTEFDQWMDVTSPNIFPIGYCEFSRVYLNKSKNDCENATTSSTSSITPVPSSSQTSSVQSLVAGSSVPSSITSSPVPSSSQTSSVHSLVAGSSVPSSITSSPVPSSSQTSSVQSLVTGSSVPSSSQTSSVQSHVAGSSVPSSSQQSSFADFNQSLGHRTTKFSVGTYPLGPKKQYIRAMNRGANTPTALQNRKFSNEPYTKNYKNETPVGNAIVSRSNNGSSITVPLGSSTSSCVASSISTLCAASGATSSMKFAMDFSQDCGYQTTEERVNEPSPVTQNMMDVDGPNIFPNEKTFGNSYETSVSAGNRNSPKATSTETCWMVNSSPNIQNFAADFGSQRARDNICASKLLERYRGLTNYAIKKCIGAETKILVLIDTLRDTVRAQEEASSYLRQTTVVQKSTNPVELAQTNPFYAKGVTSTEHLTEFRPPTKSRSIIG